MLAVLAIMVLLVGIWPDPLVSVMHPSVDNLIDQISRCKLPIESC